MSSTDFRSQRPRMVEPEAINVLVRAHEGGVEPDLRLLLAARRLRAGNPNVRVTASALAKELGTSRAGLYRHYEVDRIKQAIKEAEQPMSPVPEKNKSKDDSLQTEIAAIFADLAGFDESGRQLDGSDLLKPSPKRRKHS